VQILGDLLLLKLPSELEHRPKELQELVQRLLKLASFRSIVWLQGISGETRKPQITLLHGVSTKTVHEEAGVRYVVDVAKVMFSKLNRKERERMARIAKAGDTVVDMFAGIGYFSLPLARRATRVYAIDMNPDAIELLIEAMQLNGLLNIVPILSDNRKVLLANVADRIVMGYLFETERFISQARKFAKPNASVVVHFHRIFPNKLSKEEISEQVVRWFEQSFDEVKILGIYKIKNYAPGKIHYVVDVGCKKG
jgi:tRNA wybutosine-synthesizing protein 2